MLSDFFRGWTQFLSSWYYPSIDLTLAASNLCMLTMHSLCLLLFLLTIMAAHQQFNTIINSWSAATVPTTARTEAHKRFNCCDDCLVSKHPNHHLLGTWFNIQSTILRHYECYNKHQFLSVLVTHRIQFNAHINTCASMLLTSQAAFCTLHQNSR